MSEYDKWNESGMKRRLCDGSIHKPASEERRAGWNAAIECMMHDARHRAAVAVQVAVVNTGEHLLVKD